MSDNILVFPCGEIEPSVLLDKAKNWGMRQTLVIGIDSEGELVLGGTEDNWKDLVWLLYQANEKVRREIFEVENEQ